MSFDRTAVFPLWMYPLNCIAKCVASSKEAFSAKNFGFNSALALKRPQGCAGAGAAEEGVVDIVDEVDPGGGFRATVADLRPSLWMSLADSTFSL